jgi:hypothetical protein
MLLNHHHVANEFAPRGLTPIVHLRGRCLAQLVWVRFFKDLFKFQHQFTRCVMLFLSLDVLLNSLDIPTADGKCAIAALPFELIFKIKLIIDKVR